MSTNTVKRAKRAAMTTSTRPCGSGRRSLDQGQVWRELIDAGVIGCIETDQHVGVGPAGHVGQDPIQDLGTELGGAAPGFDAGGEFVGLGSLFH